MRAMTSKPWRSPRPSHAPCWPRRRVLAQAAAERVAAHNDWSVFVAGDPQECYIVSPPTSVAARRDGQPSEVDRGDIRLFVAFRPGENVTNEVSFTGGYPFARGQHRSTVVHRLARPSSSTPAQGDAGGWAWTEPEDDARMVAAMRARLDRDGHRRLDRAARRRWTPSRSSGFTAAVERRRGRCR